MDSLYAFSFVIPADFNAMQREAVEDAEDSRLTPLARIEAECRRLCVEARLFTPSCGFCGTVAADGNVVFG